jgi:hypothetical protein
MTTLQAIEIKAFVPAKDFAVSKAFYADMGFEQRSEFADIAFFSHGSCSFLLQNFFEPAHAQNMVMHLLVQDVRAWFAQIALADLAVHYKAHGVRITPLKDQPWGMTEFVVIDPSGVCWHIAQNMSGFELVGKLATSPSDTP